jgi:hypothetical protein
MKPFRCGHFKRLQDKQVEADFLVPLEMLGYLKEGFRFQVNHYDDIHSVTLVSIEMQEERKPATSFETYMLTRAIVTELI